jgi:hypothetical protein
VDDPYDGSEVFESMGATTRSSQVSTTLVRDVEGGGEEDRKRESRREERWGEKGRAAEMTGE